VTVVVVLAVVRNECHRVILGDMLRMGLDEFFRRIPECRDRLDELNEGDGEPIGLAVVLHVEEGVELDVAREIDVWSGGERIIK
jgi:hypothetical protein